jgi:hypothetical protein
VPAARRADASYGELLVTGLIDELGKRLAEKWMTLLVLPGLLFTAVAMASWAIGRHGWSRQSWQQLVGQAGQVTTWVGATPVRAGLVLVGLLAASASAGVAAQAAGTAVRRAWLAEYPFSQILSWNRPRRRRRWESVQRASELDGVNSEERLRLQLARNRICLAPPSRPTWMADQLAAVETRVRGQYGLDLAAAWPRLWLLLPDPVKAETNEARQAFDRSAVLGGWGLLYGLVGLLFWWPMVLVGAAALTAAWRRGRMAIAAFAGTVEAVVDLHGRDLAAALDLSHRDLALLTPPLGELITDLLRKGT